MRIHLGGEILNQARQLGHDRLHEANQALQLLGNGQPGQGKNGHQQRNQN